MRVSTALVVPGLLLGTVLTAGAANAVPPPVGGCPPGYRLMTHDEVVALPDAELALPAFYAVDLNGDFLVCYMPYPHGPQPSGHYGNFIDNIAGPHK